MDNTTTTNTTENAQAARITEPTPTAETKTPEAPQAEQRAAAADIEGDRPFRRTTRQFNLGNGSRLVDMRTTNGGLAIIQESPRVNFRDLPSMTEREAILAALDFDLMDEADRLELVRQIVTANA